MKQPYKRIGARGAKVGVPLPAPGPILVISIIALVATVIGLLVGLTQPPASRTLPVPVLLAFETLAGETQWQQHVCQCNNSWEFATNERTLSNQLFVNPGNIPDPRGLSSLVAFFGQLIDHDVVRSQSNASDGLFSLQMTPSSVFLNMTRNAHRTLDENECRETLTEITPTIDGSIIYGDSAEQLNSLRTAGCKLKSSPGNLLALDPMDPSSFLSGDPRNTEHSVLASLHTLFQREHNRLCDVLLVDRPAWTEEERFWKARQVVVAKLQHIVYSEWLPALFGPGQMHLLDSVPLRGDGLRMSMEFSVIAYRMGHSLIPEQIGDFPIPQLFFNRTLVIEHGIEYFLEGAYQEAAQKVDHFVIDGLRNFMFMVPGFAMGEDLVTRNLFRAREVGMASYPEVAACYGFPVQNAQQETYIGLLSEPLVEGSSLPRGLATIVAEQFKRLRLFDPHFYTNEAQKAAIGTYFMPEIEATTMATLIRQNTALTQVPNHVFYV